MTLVLIIIIAITVLFVIPKLIVDNKNKRAQTELGNLRICDKYKTIIDTISSHDVFFHNYEIVPVSPTQDNLCSNSNPNIIVLMCLFEGKVHLEWKYQLLQKTVVRKFSHQAAGFTEQQQRDFALQAFQEMTQAINAFQRKLGL